MWLLLTEGTSAESSACAWQKDERLRNMSKIIPKRIITMPSIAENAKIVAAARADPDAQPMTKAQLEALVPLRAVRGSLS